MLSEIGRLCVQYEFNQLLTKLRQVLLTRLKALSAVLNESADATWLPVIIARNYRTLYMASSTPDLDVVRRTDKPATPRGVSAMTRVTGVKWQLTCVTGGEFSQ